MRRSLLVVTSAFALAACDPPEMLSERGDFRLAVDDLRMPLDPLADTYWAKPYLVVAGTRMCPQLKCDACPDEETCHDAALEVSGPVIAVDADCFVAQSPGDVVWSLGPECGAPGLASDQVHMRVVAPDQVDARAWHWMDGLIASHVAREPPSMETFGGPWTDVLPRVFKVIAGEQVSLSVDLFERTSGHPVARGSEPAEVTWTTTRGREPVVYPGEDLSLVAFEGTEAAAEFQFGGHTWPIGQIVGVPAESVTSLELAGAIFIQEDPNAPLFGRTSWPLGARVTARDAAGDLIVGLPITWSADAGNMAYHPDYTEHEHILLADDCLPPLDRDGPRTLVLRASHDDLTATASFSWVGDAALKITNIRENDSTWSPPDTCLAPTGCGCTSADPTGASLLVLGLLVLGRRRRKSHVLNNMSKAACLLALPLTACSDDPPVIEATEALPLGSLQLGYGPNEGGHSLGIGDLSVWVFRNTDEDGYYLQASGAAVTTDLDARDGLYPFARHETSSEHDEDELLPLQTAEYNYRREYDGGECLEDESCPWVSLWPSAMVHDPERARILIFYSKVIQHRDSADNQHVGSSIAVWREDFGKDPIRPEVAEGSAEPTLMFGADGPRLAAAALAEDDHVFAFACDGKDNPCVLLRAPLAHALERDAWQFYNRNDTWSDSYSTAEQLFDGAAAMSVHFNPHADAYVAVHAATDNRSAVVRTAPRITGPWSDAADIFRPDSPVAPNRLRDAMLHPELAQTGGAVDYLTYFELDFNGDGTLQLVEIHWD